MNEYSFYQDIKVEIWQRLHFTIKADTKEEALEEVEKYKRRDVSEDFIVDSEYLFETENMLSPEENGGDATIELYDEATGKCLGTNVLKLGF
jgi:hypothetical protein